VDLLKEFGKKNLLNTKGSLHLIDRNSQTTFSIFQINFSRINSSPFIVMFLCRYGLFLRIPSINIDDFISNCMNVYKITSYDMN
jgi:hypothetical protein